MKSRGPKTPAGKLISSQNATRHGLVASTILIDGELPERFELLLAGMVANTNPSPKPKCCSSKTWPSVNGNNCASGASKMSGTPKKSAGRSPSPLRSPPKNTAERAFHALSELVEKKRVMEAMHRYEVRYDRQYLRALKMLQELQARKK